MNTFRNWLATRTNDVNSTRGWEIMIMFHFAMSEYDAFGRLFREFLGERDGVGSRNSNEG